MANKANLSQKSRRKEAKEAEEAKKKPKEPARARKKKKRKRKREERNENETVMRKSKTEAKEEPEDQVKSEQRVENLDEPMEVLYITGELTLAEATKKVNGILSWFSDRRMGGRKGGNSRRER